ncbi:hypothetical protein CISIN_1g043098mg, partial [Citrus sinensis]
PSFDVASNKIEKIVAWIRLVEMNIHFYHKNIIRRLGEIFGLVVKIDHKTVEVQRGKFAQIAVEIDLNKPLISQFNFEGRIQWVEYEYLPTIFFVCGKIGHYKDACPDSAEVVPQEKILSRSSIPTSSPNNVPIAMQGMLAQTGNLSTNPNDIPTIMHGMHENFNDHNTTFPHEPHATQSPMQDMHAIPSSRIPMHVPTSLNPLSS